MFTIKLRCIQSGTIMLSLRCVANVIMSQISQSMTDLELYVQAECKVGMMSRKSISDEVFYIQKPLLIRKLQPND